MQSRFLKFISILLLSFVISNIAYSQVEFKVDSLRTGQVGEKLCMNVKACNFDSVIGFAFAFQWNPSVLKFDSIYYKVPSGGSSTFGNANNGNLNLTWLADDVSCGLSLPDSIDFYRICFTIIGNLGDSSFVSVTPKTGDPLFDFIITKNGCGKDTDSQPLVKNGLIRVVNGILPLKIAASTKSVPKGDDVCVDITAADLKSITEFGFSMHFDTSVIKFNSIQSLNPQISAINFGFANVNGGTLTSTWKTTFQPLTLPDNTVLFSVCFKGIGAVGSMSAITFDSIPQPKFAKDNFNRDLPINSTNGKVTILSNSGKPLELFFNAPANIFAGQKICVDVKVKEFNELFNFAFSINWDNTKLKFDKINFINNLTPPLTLSNFNINAGFGRLGVEWLRVDGSGSTLADSSTLFQMCFEVVGQSCNTTLLEFLGNPTPIKVASISSGGADIGAITTPLTVKIGPKAVTPVHFYIGQYTVEEREKFCVDLKANQFNDVQSFQLSLNFDPNVIMIDTIYGVSIPAFNITNYNLQNNLGNALISWAPQNNNSYSFSDSSTVLRVCFTAKGLTGTMSPVSISNNPLIVEVIKSLFDTNCTKDSLYSVGYTATNGKVNIESVISVVDTIIKNSGCCNFFKSGRIELVLSGGKAPYYYVWSDGLGFNSTSPILTNVGENTYFVTITDSDTIPNHYYGTFRVESDFGKPIISVNKQYYLNCKDTVLNISASANSQGGVRYTWITDFGNIVSGANTSSVTVSLPGNYFIIAGDSLTCCSSIDTVVVSYNTNIPQFQLGKDTSINCKLPSITLNGFPNPANIVSVWKTIGGNILSDTTLQNIQINKGGSYIFTMTDTTNFCVKSDTIEVVEDFTAPTASIDPAITLNCVTESVILIGKGDIGNQFGYLWSTPDGNIVNGIASLTPLVNKGGTYMLIINNNTNGCKDTASITIKESKTKPKAFASSAPIALNCATKSATLGGTPGSVGTQYFYVWSLDGNNYSNTFNPTIPINTKGLYQVEVIDTTNGCRDTAQVVVTKDTLVPTVKITTPNSLNCQNLQLTLDAGTSSKGLRYVYTWTTSGGGNIVSGNTTLNPIVNQAGTYTLVVNDTTNKCVDSAKVTISSNVNIPTAQAVVIGRIGCDTPILTLNGSGSSTGNKIVYEWVATNGGTIASGTNTINATINKAGNYSLIVTDTSNNCKDTSLILQVKGNTNKPTAQIQGGKLTCKDSVLTIPTIGTSTGNNYTFNWKTNGGNFTTATNTLTARSNKAGNYTLIVRDTTNNCIDSSKADITEDKTLPIANAGADRILNCIDSVLTLDGNSSSSGPSFTYKWTATSGGVIQGSSTLADLIVKNAGKYILTVEDTRNNCISKDTATVIRNATQPTASIANPPVIKCPNTTIQLDGSNSTSGDTITYLWTTSTGKIVSGSTTKIVTVADSGTYFLTVINTKNQCKTAASVIVSKATFPANADAGSDIITCSDTATLLGNLPADATGEWLTLSDSLVSSTPLVKLSNLTNGNSTFVWKLSTKDCPDYSADTLQILRPRKPVAANDQFNKPFENDTILVNVGKNDNKGTNWEITLLDAPRVGSLTKSEEGVYKYTAPKTYFGDVFFTYRLCNLNCPDFCDTAQVKIYVEADPNGIENYLPNTITPNDDGLNDRLIFDIIDDAGKEFPDNELVIYNRWGDIVWQARPYLNNWYGTNQNNQPLPQGTYYYILRLDLGSGTILRGNVTILKK